MVRLLHIESCPRGDITYSFSLSKVFLEVYKEFHSSDTIEVMNLWKIDFPPVIGEMVKARYAEIDSHKWTSNNAEAWPMIKRYAEHFKSADKYLITIPTWSFGIPYVLKEYIDVVTQPELLIEFTPDGIVRGLVADHPACVLYERGGCTGPGSGRDAMVFQVSFMTGWLRLIGINHVYSVFEETIGGDPQRVREAREKTEKIATSIARSF
jgi:FMN-dependent NADH-azoreductase